MWDVDNIFFSFSPALRSLTITFIHSPHLLYLLYLFERQKEGQRERIRDRLKFPTADSLFKCLQQLRLTQAKVRSQKLNPGLPSGWPAQVLEPSPAAASQRACERKPEWEAESGLKPRHCDMR